MTLTLSDLDALEKLVKTVRLPRRMAMADEDVLAEYPPTRGQVPWSPPYEELALLVELWPLARALIAAARRDMQRQERLSLGHSEQERTALEAQVQVNEDLVERLRKAASRSEALDRALTPLLTHTRYCRSTFQHTLAGPCTCGAVERAVAAANRDGG